MSADEELPLNVKNTSGLGSWTQVWYFGTVEEAQRVTPWPIRVPTWLPTCLPERRVVVTEDAHDPQHPDRLTYDVRLQAYTDPPQRCGIDLWQYPGTLESSFALKLPPPIFGQRRVHINGVPGSYARGAYDWDNLHHPVQTWNDRADAAFLMWVENGFTYKLTTWGFSDEDVVVRIAASLREPSA